MGTRLFLELADAVRAPLARPARSALVLLAYVLGVASLVASLGLTQATTQSVVTRLTDAASREMRVIDTADLDQPWTPDDPGGRRAWVASLVKARSLAGLEGVTQSFPVRTFTATGNRVTRFGGADRAPSPAHTGGVMVTTAELVSAWGLTVAEGRIDALSDADAGPVAVLGSRAARALGIVSVEPGIVVYVNDRAVSVAALLVASGDATLDGSVFLNAGALPILTDQLDNYLWVRVASGYAEPVARAAPLVLAPENPGRIAVSTVAQLAQLQQGINADLGSMLSIVGWVILTLSALTAGATMYLSVAHRGAEIALRRAMGASRASIWRLFTYEGVAIGLAGGVWGTAVGTGVTWAVTAAQGWPLSLGLGVVALGITVGLVAGVLASVVPALHAARRDPAGLLRVA